MKDLGPSSSRSIGAARSQPITERQSVPALCCDLCQWPMSLPEHIREQGEILGLLVCSQCVEDQLEALNYERTREAH